MISSLEPWAFLPHYATAPIAGIGLLSGTLPLPLGKAHWIRTE